MVLWPWQLKVPQQYDWNWILLHRKWKAKAAPAMIVTHGEWQTGAGLGASERGELAQKPPQQSRDLSRQQHPTGTNDRELFCHPSWSRESASSGVYLWASQKLTSLGGVFWPLRELSPHPLPAIWYTFVVSISVWTPLQSITLRRNEAQLLLRKGSRVSPKLQVAV